MTHSEMIVVAGALVLLEQSLAQSLGAKLEEVDKQVVRLKPNAFKELPRSIVLELAHRRCSIPQATTEPVGHNVISGQFAVRGQIDWAALCSVDGVSSILIFWKGSATNVASIAPRRDKEFIQAFDKGLFGFSRRIRAVNRDSILSHYKAYGGPSPPAVIDHQAIEDAYVQKASVFWYYYQARWLRLTGAD
jgi:hypothetical protein